METQADFARSTIVEAYDAWIRVKHGGALPFNAPQWAAPTSQDETLDAFIGRLQKEIGGEFDQVVAAMSRHEWNDFVQAVAEDAAWPERGLVGKPDMMKKSRQVIMIGRRGGKIVKLGGGSKRSQYLRHNESVPQRPKHIHLSGSENRTLTTTWEEGTASVEILPDGKVVYTGDATTGLRGGKVVKVNPGRKFRSLNRLTSILTHGKHVDGEAFFAGETKSGASTPAQPPRKPSAPVKPGRVTVKQPVTRSEGTQGALPEGFAPLKHLTQYGVADKHLVPLPEGRYFSAPMGRLRGHDKYGEWLNNSETVAIKVNGRLYWKEVRYYGKGRKLRTFYMDDTPGSDGFELPPSSRLKSFMEMTADPKVQAVLYANELTDEMKRISRNARMNPRPGRSEEVFDLTEGADDAFKAGPMKFDDGIAGDLFGHALNDDIAPPDPDRGEYDPIGLKERAWRHRLGMTTGFIFHQPRRWPSNAGFTRYEADKDLARAFQTLHVNHMLVRPDPSNWGISSRLMLIGDDDRLAKTVKNYSGDTIASAWCNASDIVCRINSGRGAHGLQRTFIHEYLHQIANSNSFGAKAHRAFNEAMDAAGADTDPKFITAHSYNGRVATEQPEVGGRYVEDWAQSGDDIMNHHNDTHRWLTSERWGASAASLTAKTAFNKAYRTEIMKAKGVK